VASIPSFACILCGQDISEARGEKECDRRENGRGIVIGRPYLGSVLLRTKRAKPLARIQQHSSSFDF
jgi:hypothetical protein